jgi:uncharacterized UPF0146 family protein
MALPELSAVLIVNELVVAVVLGFYKPLNTTVKGVPVLVYALVKASEIVTVIGEVADGVQVTVLVTPLAVTEQLVKVDLWGGKVISEGNMTLILPFAGIVLSGVNCRV